MYEIIPHRTVRHEFVKTKKGMVVSSFALITSSVHMAILATCRIINEEAKPIVQKKINQLLNARADSVSFPPFLTNVHPLEPGVLYPRIEADCEALAALSSGYGPFQAIKDYYKLLRVDSPRTNCSDVLIKFGLHVRSHLKKYQFRDFTVYGTSDRMLSFVVNAAFRLLLQERHIISSNGKNFYGCKIENAEIHVALIERPNDLTTYLSKRRPRKSASLLGEHLGTPAEMGSIVVVVTTCNHDNWTKEHGLGELYNTWIDGFLKYSNADIARRSKDFRGHDDAWVDPGMALGVNSRGFGIEDRDKYWRDCEWL